MSFLPVVLIPRADLNSSHSHHPCTEQICLEKKFVVFGSEVDLKAHMVNEVSLLSV